MISMTNFLWTFITINITFMAYDFPFVIRSLHYPYFFVELRYARSFHSGYLSFIRLHGEGAKNILIQFKKHWKI